MAGYEAGNRRSRGISTESTAPLTSQMKNVDQQLSFVRGRAERKHLVDFGLSCFDLQLSWNLLMLWNLLVLESSYVVESPRPGVVAKVVMSQEE